MLIIVLYRHVCVCLPGCTSVWSEGIKGGQIVSNCWECVWVAKESKCLADNKKMSERPSLAKSQRARNPLNYLGQIAGLFLINKTLDKPYITCLEAEGLIFSKTKKPVGKHTARVAVKKLYVFICCRHAVCERRPQNWAATQKKSLLLIKIGKKPNISGSRCCFGHHNKKSVASRYRLLCFQVPTVTVSRFLVLSLSQLHVALMKLIKTITTDGDRINKRKSIDINVNVNILRY